MAVFSYRGYDRKGKEVKGVVEASSRTGAVEKLKSQGIYPYELREEKERKKSIRTILYVFPCFFFFPSFA